MEQTTGTSGVTRGPRRRILAWLISFCTLVFIMDLAAHASGLFAAPETRWLTYSLIILMLIALAGLGWIALTWHETARAKMAGYEELVQQMGEGVGVVDLNEKFVYANPAAERIFGVGPGELAGRRIQDFVSAKDYSDVLSQTAKRLQSLTSSYELKIINAQGDQRHINITASPELDSHGQIYATYGLFQDVTERRQAEDALRELNQELEQRIAQRTADLSRSEERYRLLVDTMPDGLAVQDRGMRLTYVNQSFCAMLGYREDELIGRPATEFLDERNQQLLISQTGLRRQGHRGQYELDWTHRSGRQVTTMVSPAPILDQNGNFQGSFAVLNDITEAKRSSMLQRKHWQLLDGIATATYLLVTATDRNEAIEQTLAVLGHAAGADRVLLFANCKDESTGDAQYQYSQGWAREGVAIEKHANGSLAHKYEDALPGWYEELNLGRPVTRLASYGPASGRAESALNGAKSQLAVPVWLGSEMWGFIRLDDCRTEREWTDSEVTTLLAVAGSVGGFIAKALAEEQREQVIGELRDALAQIKVLRGLLPICSYCKKIRDDRGYWNQIEAYVARHTDAEFSHSICPDCLEVHFPSLGLDESDSLIADPRD